MRLKVLVVSDHESAYLWDHFDRKAFADIDAIVSCGDLKGEYLSFLVTMLPVPLLYVPGNHDGRYAFKPPEGCVCLDGRMATVKGVRFVGLGGCKSPQDKPNHHTEIAMRKRINRLIPTIRAHGGFDVLVTHSAARGLGDGTDAFHEGFDCFTELLDKYAPAYHLHGHEHLSYSANPQRIRAYGATTIVNGFDYALIEMDIPDRQPDRSLGGVWRGLCAQVYARKMEKERDDPYGRSQH